MDKYKITDSEMNSGVAAAPNTLTDTAPKNKMVFDRLPKLIAEKFNTFVSGMAEKFKGYYTKEETDAAIDKKMVEMGKGDMAKTTYDKNGDGVVEDSDRLGGELPNHYATAEQMKTVAEQMMPKANFEFDEATATLKITL